MPFLEKVITSKQLRTQIQENYYDQRRNRQKKVFINGAEVEMGTKLQVQKRAQN
jgi:hypothetical protein